MKSNNCYVSLTILFNTQNFVALIHFWFDRKNNKFKAVQIENFINV